MIRNRAIAGTLLMTILVGSSPAGAQKAPEACDREPKGETGIVLYTPLGVSQGRVCLDDGDSFSIGPNWVRLAGIDAPDIPRNCLKHQDNPPLRCQAAMEALGQLDDILYEGAECIAQYRDGRNRWLAECRTRSGKDVAAEMVKKGWACADTRYDKQSAVKFHQFADIVD